VLFNFNINLKPISQKEPPVSTGSVKKCCLYLTVRSSKQ